MKTPSFWYDTTSPSTLSDLMMPLARLYTRVARAHKSRKAPREVAVPVICLGNLLAGGSGKTPTAIALLRLLQDARLFLSPAFVTRGYKGTIEGPERVDNSHDATMWGDEALLLAHIAPTYVAHDRYAGVSLAVESGADAVLLDDGLQNYSLVKNISFCVLDGMMGFGNERVIPAGPLRTPLEEGFENIDAFILIGDDTRNIREKLPAHKPVFGARLHIREPLALARAPYIAFCGIGYPEKFRKTIEDAGIALAGWHSFADHYRYTMDDMTKLVNAAIENKARLLTTEKDFVRLPDFHQKSMIDVLPVDIVFDSPSTIIDFIRDNLSAHTMNAA